MPRKRRIPKPRRTTLTPAWRVYFMTGQDYGEHPEHRGIDLWQVCLGVLPAKLITMWRAYGAEIVADWILEHPGSRPWAWWRWDATEPRRVVRGAELLLKTEPPCEWHWRENFGALKFVESRPPGFLGLPELEGEGAYLRRLGLLRAGERPAPTTLTSQEFDPWTEPEDDDEEGE